MKKGFTLIELLVSIVVIGILMTIGYKGYTAIISNAKASQLVDQLGQIKAAMAKYYKDMGTYPYDLTYLFKAPTDDKYCGMDAISLAMNGEDGDNGDCPDDKELINYWGGPYLNGMTLSPDSPGCIKAKVGGAICVGAALTDSDGQVFDTEQGAAGKMIAMPGTATFGTVLELGKSHSNEDGSNRYYNVLQVNRITKQIAKKVVNKLNGKNPPLNGNLVDVAQAESKEGGDVTQVVGVPKDTVYSKFDRIIYRYNREF